MAPSLTGSANADFLVFTELTLPITAGTGHAAQRATASHRRQQALVAGTEQSHADRLRPIQLRAQGEAIHI